MAKPNAKQLRSADTLLTGFPGFLATHVVERLAREMSGGTVFLLIESRFRDTATRRLEEIERRVENASVAFELVEGDITDEKLRLGKRWRELAGRVGVVWHLAAIYDLAVPELLAYRVNVGGTQNVLAFCEACSDFQRFNYVSTCFVSGERIGTIFEDELDEGQAHHNHYEATKFWAEMEVQRRLDDVPATILRPSIVVGHSVTGETDKYDGPYYFLKVLRKYPDWLPFPNVAGGNTMVNIIPVDFAADAIVHLGLDAGHEGKTYQIADPNPMRARDIVTLALELMEKAGAVGSVPPRLVQAFLENPKLEEAVGVPREVVRYFTHDARYDVTQSEAALDEAGIRCPHLSTYLQALIDYVDRNPEKEFLDRRRV